MTQDQKAFLVDAVRQVIAAYYSNNKKELTEAIKYLTRAYEFSIN